MACNPLTNHLPSTEIADGSYGQLSWSWWEVMSFKDDYTPEG